jgi:hypothetical protein
LRKARPTIGRDVPMERLRAAPPTPYATGKRAAATPCRAGDKSHRAGDIPRDTDGGTGSNRAPI